MKTPKLTDKQKTLMSILPACGSAGLYLKGPQRQTAETLVKRGLAQKLDEGFRNGAYYVRAEGAEA